MQKKIISAAVSAGAHALARRWALDQGCTVAQANALAWLVATVAAALVMRI